jgi:hypothetical protein
MWDKQALKGKEFEDQVERGAFQKVIYSAEAPTCFSGDLRAARTIVRL